MKISPLILCLAGFVAQPASAQSWAQPVRAQATVPSLQRLEQRLAATALDNPGEFGIAAVDLSTGRLAAFNGDTPFPMASTVKVAIAATYLSQVDEGRRSLGDLSGAATAASLMERMIIHSDNHATDQLLAMLGGPGTVEAWLQANGLAGIRIDRTIAQLLAAPRDLKDSRDSSTPKAMLGLLGAIDSGRVLKPDSRLVLLDLMRRCATGKNRIKALLPPGTPIEHKTGTLSGYSGDVAFVTLPDGRRIALAIFARGGENRPGVIATLARAIYDGFTAEAAADAGQPGAGRGTNSSFR